jgi:hypothetical protein
VQEFITTRQGYRLATSTGGVLTAHGTTNRLQRFCASRDPEEGLSGLDSVHFWTLHETEPRWQIQIHDCDSNGTTFQEMF